MLKEIILVTFLISLVKSHGNFREPPIRNPRNRQNFGEFVGQGCNVGWDETFFNNFECSTVCGNRHGQSYPDENDNTAGTKIQRTYTSGQWIDVTSEHTDHAGELRVKLCKLSSPTQNPTQACFDENNLELRPVSYDNSLIEWYNINNLAGLQVDKYTIRKTMYNDSAKALNKASTTGAYRVTQNFQAKLPDGLSCDNCVLQLISQSTVNCLYQDGKPAPYNEYCPSQTYLGCSDIKINPNPSKPASMYKSAPVQRQRLNQPVIAVFPWPYHDKILANLRLSPVDPLRNSPNAWGLICIHNGGFGRADNERCLPCIDKTKTCPSVCLCRWFDEKALKFSARV